MEGSGRARAQGQVGKAGVVSQGRRCHKARPAQLHREGLGPHNRPRCCSPGKLASGLAWLCSGVWPLASHCQIHDTSKPGTFIPCGNSGVGRWLRVEGSSDDWPALPSVGLTAYRTFGWFDCHRHRLRTGRHSTGRHRLGAYKAGWAADCRHGSIERV